jgi:hypothetical protein
MERWKLIALKTPLPEACAVKTAFRHRAIWISVIAEGLIFSGAHRCTAIDAATATGRMESAISISSASNPAVRPQRTVKDDPPTREPGTKKRAHFLASFGLLVIIVLILIVGAGLLRAFRQR